MFCHYFPHFTALFATPENRHYLLSSPQQLSGNKTYQNHKSVHYSFKRIANKRMLLAECSAKIPWFGIFLCACVDAGNGKRHDEHDRE